MLSDTPTTRPTMSPAQLGHTRRGVRHPTAGEHGGEAQRSVTLGRRLRRLGALRSGQLRLFVTATDAAGNRSAKRVLKLRLRK
jgi:hypothetical protein